MENQVIRFKKPILEEYKQEIESEGATILQPLKPRELVISVPSQEIIEELKTLDYIEDITPYEPEVRVQPQYLQNLGQKATPEALREARLKAAQTPPSSQPKNIPLPGILIANFFTEEDRDRASKTLEDQGIRIAERPGKTRLVLDVSTKSNAPELLKKIIKEAGLQSLEEKSIPRLFNNHACRVIGQDVIPSNPDPDPDKLSLTGEDEIIAIADTGLDTGDQTTLHLDFQGRIAMIKSYPISPAWKSYVSNPGADDGASDQYTGHGTHVAGSALGNGEQARTLKLDSIPSGMAPKAKLVFQAIEQRFKCSPEGLLQWWNDFRQAPPHSGLFGIPDDLKTLFEDAYNQSARIHSNSWGGGLPGGYDSQCYDLDQFVWEHKDFLVLVAAGNDGKQTSSLNGIDQGSVTPPGTAKNCLTVGACENNRPDIPDTYGNWWPKDFPYDKIKSDPMSDSVDDIVAFSSRGPCQDRRRKPDVVAPGTFILSTRSSQMPENNFAWGAYSPAKQYYMYMGGTSMATPLVAGCAALVRQYLREKKDINNPKAALIKAILIHSAQYIDYRYKHPSSQPPADNEQGWGRVNLATVLNPPAPIEVKFIDESQGLKTSETKEYHLQVSENTGPLKVTLVYTDYPGEGLKNNLTLTLLSPNGEEIHNHDPLNNVEMVFIPSPDIGKWTVKVTAVDISYGPQDYALVISGKYTYIPEPTGAVEDNSNLG